MMDGNLLVCKKCGIEQPTTEFRVPRFCKTCQRAYNLERGIKRHRELQNEFHALLGGKCCKCSAVENLQFDHIDRATKSFNIAEKLNSKSYDVLLQEVKKCQLLCHPCHKLKSAKELSIANKGKRTKLTADQVCDIKFKRLKLTEYATLYNISFQHVSAIQRGIR
jgi:hypothetical protein